MPPPRKLTLLVLVVFFGIILLLVAIVAIIYAIRLTRFLSALGTIVTNDSYCQSQEGPCLLDVTDTLTQPLHALTVYDPLTARYCSDLVARLELLFYQKHGRATLDMPPNLQVSTVLYYNEHIIGFVAHSSLSKLAWVVFRGTANDVEWSRDFEFGQSPFFLRDHHEPLHCHMGFVRIYHDLQATLRQALQDLQPEGVIMTGHSLGASLATLASLDASTSYPVYTYVFGAPRVCNRIPPILQAYWRLNNTADVIPSMPLAVMPNVQNIDQPYLYTHGGVAVEFTDNRQSLSNNHLLPVYIHALTQARPEVLLLQGCLATAVSRVV